jgi:hypothetical protein
MLPEFLIQFRNGSWHIACGNQMFGSYETLVSAITAAVKIARVNLVNLPTRVVVERTDGDRETFGTPRNRR